jgi:hypothetical protein
MITPTAPSRSIRSRNSCASGCRLESPTALQLRLFQTLTEIASENNSTVILPVPIDLSRPYLGASNGFGDGQVCQSQAQRKEEEEAERLYEEAVGEASSEQQAMQDLTPEGPNGHPSTPSEDAANLGEESPLGGEPPRPESS